MYIAPGIFGVIHKAGLSILPLTYTLSFMDPSYIKRLNWVLLKINNVMPNFLSILLEQGLLYEYITYY